MLGLIPLSIVKGNAELREALLQGEGIKALR